MDNNTYPHLDSAVEQGNSPLVERLEGTRAKLDRAFRIGAGRDRDRARVALAAYDRALDLYRRLIDLRDEARAAPDSNMHGGTAITK
jgi:hypothetical protein